jgi:hypothetical protein
VDGGVATLARDQAAESFEARPGGGPTVLRILLGAQLRRLREAKAVTRADAGWEIGAPGSRISRMELGRIGLKPSDVADLLTLYGVGDPEEREALLGLARRADTPGWWQQFSDSLPRRFESYLGLEAAARLIRTYEIQFVPGLLQTAEYARAVLTLAYPEVSAEERERQVELRRLRQRALDRPDGPQLWALIDEAALRRPIGGADVMVAQIEFLIEVAKKPNVRLQIIPFAAGGRATTSGPFTILRFPEPQLPDVVYLEQLTSALYLDRREDVDQYAVALEQACVNAQPPNYTPELLARLLYEIGCVY